MRFYIRNTENLPNMIYVDYVCVTIDKHISKIFMEIWKTKNKQDDPEEVKKSYIF